jgi:glycosyltransferase involved in cell wall biosynthesis
MSRYARRPVISVLLPFRDAASTLAEAVLSVLSEEVELEVIAIDDGSRDESAEVLPYDPRVRMLRTDGIGIARALSLGLEHARGSLIARMDADDLSLPGRFAAQLAALRGDIAVVATRVEAFPDGAIGNGLRRYVGWMNEAITPEDHAREIFVEAPLCHPSVLMRRDALEQVGGYRDVDGPEDYDLWLRFHAHGFRFAKVPEVFLRWRHHERRATVVDPRYAIERFTATKAPHLARFLAGRGFAIWGAGPTGKRLARALEPHGARAAKFIDVDPEKREARGVAVIAPHKLVRGEYVIVVAVGARGARELIRADLNRRGFTEGADFICAS